MGLVVGAAAAILSAISATAAVVISVVAAAVVYVASALAYIGTIVWAAGVTVVTGVMEAITVVTGYVGAHVASAVSALKAASLAAYATISELVSATVAGFQAFLEAIHFATLMKVHNIAYLVSGNYRTMMLNIYGEMANFSRAIGMSSQFVALAIRNARSVVLDVSTMAGRKYDLAELGWLTEMGTFMEGINEKAMEIAQNPERLLLEIDAKIMRPAVDLKGEIMQGVYTTLDNMLTSTTGFIDDIVGVKTGVEQLISDLPANVRNYVTPMLANILDPFDDFLDDVYRPGIAQISGVLEVVNTRMDTAYTNVENIVGRLKRPGDIIEGVSGLPEAEKTAQLDKMFVTINEPFNKIGSLVSARVKQEEEKLQSIVDALSYDLTPAKYTLLESPAPNKGSIGTIEQKDTWFIGDY